MLTRGAVDFTFKGKKITLRPDMDSVDYIEDTLGKTIIRMGIDLGKGDGMFFKDICVLVYAGISGHYRNIGKPDEAPELDDIRKELFKKGIVRSELMGAVGSFLTCCITSDDEIEAMGKTNLKKKK